MSYNGLTNQGLEYLTRCQVESKPVVFSKVKIGNGNIPMGNTGETTTDLYSFKKEIEILNKEQVENSIKMEILINNFDVLEEFYVKEIGVYVMDNDVEKLYWYINKDRPSPLPDKNTPAKHRYILHLETSQIESIILNYTGLDLMVDKEFVETKFNEAKDRVKAVQFPNIESLKLKNLRVGDIVEVLGYYEVGDGAGHKRIIANEDDGSGVQLNNKLWANIVHNGEVNSSWFGCKYNSLESARTNYTNLLKAVNYNQTVNITEDLYIEQNGDNVVTSENLILKGKDNAKLIFSNGDKTNYFLINNNKNNIIFNDLVISFNEKNSLRFTQILSVAGMLKIKKIEIKRCLFEIETQARFIYWGNISLTTKPDINLHGIDTFDIADNKFINPQISFIKMYDVIYREFNFKNNYINNFYYVFINLPTTNEHSYAKEVSDNKFITTIENNIVINDDDYIFNSTAPEDNDSYYCFALVEGKLMNYKNNYIEGIKSQSVTALYDLYFNGETIYYENNTWKNNLCFNIGKINAVLMKSKGTVNRYYSNNNFIIEKEFITKHSVDEKALWVMFDQKITPKGETIIKNNYINVPHLRFYDRTSYTPNHTIINNQINSEVTTGFVFSFEYSLGDNSHNYIFKNNILNLGILKSGSLFVSDYTKKVYDNIIIKDNSVNFIVAESIKDFYIFSSDLKSKFIIIENNNIVNIKDNNITNYSLFNSYKKIDCERIILNNNNFSFSLSLNNNAYQWLMLDIISANTSSVARIKYKNLNTSKYIYIFKCFFNTTENDITKIKYRVKFHCKKESKDEEYYLYFTLEKVAGVEYIEYYNSLGTITRETINWESSDRKNMYLFDRNNNITQEAIQEIVFSKESKELRYGFVKGQTCLEMSVDFDIN